MVHIGCSSEVPPVHLFGRNCGFYAKLPTKIHASWRNFVDEMHMTRLINVPKMVKIGWSSEVPPVHLFGHNSGFHSKIPINIHEIWRSFVIMMQMLWAIYERKWVQIRRNSEVPPVHLFGRNFGFYAKLPTNIPAKWRNFVMKK